MLAYGDVPSEPLGQDAWCDEDGSLTGWILTWLPEGEGRYMLEFFPNSLGRQRSTYVYCFRTASSGWLYKPSIRLTAQERAETELELLRSGVIEKNGRKVVDCYVVRGRLIDGRIVPDCGRDQVRPRNDVEIS